MTSASQPASGQVRYGTAIGRWVLLATILGSGIAALDATVVNVALPAIAKDFNSGVAGLQWVVTAYLLTLASLILLGGSLGDRYGRRKVFTIGVAWFTVASLLSGIAPNLELLIAARALQGIGGALLTPGSLAIIEASFEPDDRGRAIGAWSGMGGIATAIGPFAGGYLISAVSWRLIFLLNLPLAFIVLVAVRRVPESRNPSLMGPLDVRGSVLGAVGLGGSTYALIEGPAGASTGVVIAAAVIGVAVLVGFVLAETRSDSPMVPLDIFRSRQFSAANLVTFAVYAALGGIFFLLVINLQVSLGYSPLEAGAAMLPVTLLMLVLSPSAGALSQRIGPRIPMTFGPVIVAFGLLLMTRISPGTTYLESVFPAVFVFGLGLSLMVAPLTATVLAAASSENAGVASGINNAVARVAGLIAVAALPAVAGLTGNAESSATAFTRGFHRASLVCAGLVGLGAAIAWVGIRNPLVSSTEVENGPASTPPVAG
ncbi:MAG TPA: DHA2 family efflux MFS transporter permease subunit [Microthrixaceae bacterium]|nr:DHA2 family efflux MFS transporter permease subunit [Microthrixaceae bacterium]